MIERTYLQWIGTSSFATIDEFVDEARRCGVCKKLPNRAVANEMSSHVTVIFLAHDQGRYRQCIRCAELVTCPACDGRCEADGTRCQRCRGLGSIERGTGGQAIVDGETWSYIRLLQLKKNRYHDFWKSKHNFGRIWHCEDCGGRGKIPIGVVFGFFVPAWVTYAASGAEARRFKTGYFDKDFAQSGGWYAVSPPNDVSASLGLMPTVPEDLRVEIEGLVGMCEYVSGLGLLDTRIPYEGKHFRGVKKWEPPVLITHENSDLLEGVV